jgi:hypothetical protein
MKKTVFAIAVSAAIGPLGAAAYAADSGDIITQLLDKAAEIYSDKGFTQTGWSYQSKLGKGGEERMAVTLNGGQNYQVIGVCDTDCSDLDIHLLDSTGNEIDKDTEKDDFPIVGIATSGTYTLRIVMSDCAVDPCSYAVKAFRQ